MYNIYNIQYIVVAIETPVHVDESVRFKLLSP